MTLHDPRRTVPGFHLYTDEVDQVRLVDMTGSLRHTWRVPGRTQCSYAELLDGGRVLVLSADEGLTLLDWDSNVQWAIDLHAHHDVAPLASGDFLVLEWVEDPDYRGRRVRFDRLVRVTADGAAATAWDGREHRAELARLHPPLALDTEPPGHPGSGTIYDYHHLNSVEEIPPHARAGDPRFRPGNLLLCARNANLLFILDADTHDVVWHWRPGTIDFPHMPTMTPDGTILVFDNGYHRGASQVLELDPATLEIVWRWPAPGTAFFTKERGSVQRLTGGNTLVLESQRGHALEVTPGGEVVWEFWNPELRDGKRRRIYRLLRVVPALLPLELGSPYPR
ncbi:MAG: arylsulfotransferase family protein [Planctomycetota bacterium]